MNKQTLYPSDLLVRVILVIGLAWIVINANQYFN